MQESVAGTTGSVRKIRAMLSESLTRLDEGSPIRPLIQQLRDDCNRYLTPVEMSRNRRWDQNRDELITWRASFANQLAQFGETYELEETSQLADRISRELRWGMEGKGIPLSIPIEKPPSESPLDLSLPPPGEAPPVAPPRPQDDSDWT
jgi:hypothetical protein